VSQSILWNGERDPMPNLQTRPPCGSRVRLSDEKARSIRVCVYAAGDVLGGERVQAGSEAL
jgi:hypothetical protein